MADFDINSPNDYVPFDYDNGDGYAGSDTATDGRQPDATLPKSAIGKGGLAAMALAQHGAPGNPNMISRPQTLGGGLSTPGGQQMLEDTMFSRIRSPEQVADAKTARQGALAQLQQALMAPKVNTNGLDNLLLGLAQNDKPWDVGNGFRGGVANMIQARMGNQAQQYDAAVKSAQAAQEFDMGEEKNDQAQEKDALDNLQKLAKPVKLGANGGAGGGVRFKNVPGTGLVDTWNVDENGVPKVVYGDSKMLTEVRQKALKIAEDRSKSDQNMIDFKDDAERKAYVNSTADQIAAQMLQAPVPGAPGGPVVASQPATPGKTASPTTKLPEGDIDPKILDGVRATESGKGDGLVVNAKTKAMGPYQFLPETVAMLHKQGYEFNPFNEKEARQAANVYLTDLKNKNGGDLNKALAQYGGHITADPTGYINKVTGSTASNPDLKILGPEAQASRNEYAKGIAKQNIEFATQATKDLATGQQMSFAVKDLSQLPFNPGYFAKWQQKGGSLLDALGSNGPLAKMAANSTNAEGILQQLSNARMTLEHGTQTESDEARFKKEIAQITNPKDAWNYMMKHMNELAARSQDKYDTTQKVLKTNGGNDYSGAIDTWSKKTSSYGPLVRRYNGGYIGRSEFINAAVKDPNNLKAYGGDADKVRARAESEWQKLGN